MSDVYPVGIGVSCDSVRGCGAELRADFVVTDEDSKYVRLGLILDHALDAGWVVVGREAPLTAETFCPRHEAEGRTATTQ